jgi:hypothetical protein
MNDSRSMVRSWQAVVAALALLFGLIVAPHMHVHQGADAQAHHTHETTLVHAHVTPHSDSGHREEKSGNTDENPSPRMWSVDGFVFQAAAVAYAPSPVLVAEIIIHVDRTSRRLGVQRERPTAHGPPTDTGADLRAPPAFPPAVI